jgi:serine protease Do
VTELFSDLSGSIRQAAARVGPAVVGVGRGGSGLIIGQDLVLTNAHNIRGDEQRVNFSDGRREQGSVRGVDVDGDLAVLAVPTGPDPGVAFAGDGPQAGDVIVALADPGGRGLRVTLGTVSSVSRAFRGPRGRRIGGSFEHTAPLARGSSGGPVVNMAGEVLGINTNRLQDGFYLALPAGADLQRRIEALARGESPRARRLGVALAPPPAAARLRGAAGLDPVDGLLVRAVEEDGPAARAGIRRGDVLIAAGERDLLTVDDLHAALDEAGEGFTLKLVRGTEELAVTVELGDAGTGGDTGGAGGSGGTSGGPST